MHKGYHELVIMMEMWLPREHWAVVREHEGHNALQGSPWKHGDSNGHHGNEQGTIHTKDHRK